MAIFNSYVKLPEGKVKDGRDIHRVGDLRTFSEQMLTKVMLIITHTDVCFVVFVVSM